MTETSVRVKRSRARGRYGEYRLAKRVNGVVVGRSKAVILPCGKTIKIDCQKPPDVIDGKGLFSFESKWLQRVPAMLDKVMGQAIGNAPNGLVPVGVIGDRTNRVVYYILAERDFLDLFIGNKEI